MLPNPQREVHSLSAAHPVPGVKMFNVKEIQQHLWDIFILTDDLLIRQEDRDLSL